MKLFRVKIYGRGGDGIKFLSKMITFWLCEKYGFDFVTISTKYDSAVRAGKINVTLCLSHDHIECNPYSDSFDVGIVTGEYDVFDNIKYAFINKNFSKIIKIDTAKYIKMIDFSCKSDLRYNECIFESMKKELCKAALNQRFIAEAPIVLVFCADEEKCGTLIPVWAECFFHGLQGYYSDERVVLKVH
jgi:Pyruvate/2-oxoacid:ferredoxin oxidoreductase gamma subunit